MTGKWRMRQSSWLLFCCGPWTSGMRFFSGCLWSRNASVVHTWRNLLNLRQWTDPCPTKTRLFLLVVKPCLRLSPDCLLLVPHRCDCQNYPCPSAYMFFQSHDWLVCVDYFLRILWSMPPWSSLLLLARSERRSTRTAAIQSRGGSCPHSKWNRGRICAHWKGTRRADPWKRRECHDVAPWQTHQTGSARCRSWRLRRREPGWTASLWQFHADLCSTWEAHSSKEISTKMNKQLYNKVHLLTDILQIWRSQYTWSSMYPLWFCWTFA